MKAERLEEGMAVRHCALSLVGMYRFSLSLITALSLDFLFDIVINKAFDSKITMKLLKKTSSSNPFMQ